mgnify:CR=1 FL=1
MYVRLNCSGFCWFFDIIYAYQHIIVELFTHIQCYHVENSFCLFEFITDWKFQWNRNMSQYIDFAVIVLTSTLSLLAGRDMCILFVRSLLHFFRIFFWVLLDFHNIWIPSVHHLWTESKSGEIIFEFIWLYLLYLFCFRYLQAKTPAAEMLPPQSTPALYPQRTTKAIPQPMRMTTTHEEYIKPDPKPILDSAPAPLPAAATLRLRPENNKPGGGSMPLNLNENITAQDRALSEQVGIYVIRYTEEFSSMHFTWNDRHAQSITLHKSVIGMAGYSCIVGMPFLFAIYLWNWVDIGCERMLCHKHTWKNPIYPENCDTCMYNKWLISLLCLPIPCVRALLTGFDSLYMVFVIYDSYSK